MKTEQALNHERRKQLAKIKDIIRRKRLGQIGPRMLDANGKAIVLLASLCTAIFVSETSGAALIGAIAASLAVSILFHYRTRTTSTKPRTWDEALDEALATYVPVDDKQYQALQADIELLGWCSGTFVKWVEDEYFRISHSENLLKIPSGSKFLNRDKRATGADRA